MILTLILPYLFTSVFVDIENITNIWVNMWQEQLAGVFPSTI